MQRFVIRQNMERFRRMLEQETDPAKRDVLARLLAAEEERASRADEPPPGPPKP